MGCRGTAYVHLWDMSARVSPSLAFFDFPFNESFHLFEFGPRLHIGSPCSVHLGDDSLAAVFRRQADRDSEQVAGGDRHVRRGGLGIEEFTDRRQPPLLFGAKMPTPSFLAFTGLSSLVPPPA